MDMESSPEHACQISMLWNWYTIDSCFIAKSWHVRTKGMFAGTCIGVFLMVFFSQWLARLAKEFDKAVDSQRVERTFPVESDSSIDKSGVNCAPRVQRDVFVDRPILYTLSHRWLFQPANISFGHHVIKCGLFTVQWGLSYLIMLLFMYYNGYVIISCILGAFFGKLAFSVSEPAVQEEVSCCKE